MPDNVQNVTELTAQLVASGRQETEQLDDLKRDVLDAMNSGEYRVNRREDPFILIRVITEGQPDDKAGLNAWQRLIPAKPNPDGSGVKHFQVPLPPGLNAISDELF